MANSAIKTATLHIKIPPTIKLRAQQMARESEMSMAAWIEMLIRMEVRRQQCQCDS